jgi:hypothetical protein
MLVTGRQPPSVKWVSQLHFTLVMDDDLLFSTQDSGLLTSFRCSLPPILSLQSIKTSLRLPLLSKIVGLSNDGNGQFETKPPSYTLT